MFAQRCMLFKRAILPILLLIVLPLNGQSWISLKYTGGFPMYKLFGRTPEYSNGFSFERYTPNLLGEDTEKHDWRLGLQGEVLIGNGISQKHLFPSLSPSLYNIKLSRSSIGATAFLRYTNTEKSIHPYVEFGAGIRDFITELEIQADDPTSISSFTRTYSTDQYYLNLVIGSGIMVPLTEDIKFEFGINYNIGKNAKLYDFNSVYASNNALYVSQVNTGTSSLQLDVGFVFNFRRRNHDWSMFRNLGSGNSLLELLFF